MVKIKDVNIADFGIEAITDNGIVQLKENKKGTLSVDTYNKMIDPNNKEFEMAETDAAEITEVEEEKDYEIFVTEDGVKKVRTSGGNTYPEGTPEYAKITGEAQHGLHIAMRPILNFNILRVEFPQEIIDELNEHIDSDIIPKSKSYADGLVGQ